METLLATSRVASYKPEMGRGAKLLKDAGEALYGERWQTPLARDLGVTDRTVRNWTSAKYDYPPDLPDRLLRLLRHREVSVGKLISLVERNIGGRA